MILTLKVAGFGYQYLQFGCNYGRDLIRCQDRLGSPTYFMELMKEPSCGWRQIILTAGRDNRSRLPRISGSNDDCEANPSRGLSIAPLLPRSVVKHTFARIKCVTRPRIRADDT
jgi:hypothetical protein